MASLILKDETLLIKPENASINNEAVALLEQVLADLKAGKISTVGVVVITPQSGIGHFASGRQLGELMIGNGLFRDWLVDLFRPKKSISN